MEKEFVITEITRVIMVGKEDFSQPKNSFGRSLQQNELIFHFSGRTTVFFDDQILETTPNSIRFLPRGEALRYDVLRHEAGECIDVFFRTDRPVAPRAFVVSASQNEKIGMLFRRLFSTWVSRTEGYYFESISLLYRILAEMQKSTSSGHYRQKIAPAIEIIHNEFLMSDLSVGMLGKACGMGESYFQKLFKKIYGISPKKYIIQLKINHACELLCLGAYSVSQIAELCNFSDVYFFSRQFKEYVGVPPTQFAKNSGPSLPQKVQSKAL